MMTSRMQLIVCGACLVLLSGILCDGNPMGDPEDKYNQCLDQMNYMEVEVTYCVASLNSEDSLNETLKLYNGTIIPYARHFCRTRDLMLTCVREVINKWSKASNRTEYLLPFLIKVFEEAVPLICENDGEMVEAYFSSCHTSDCGSCLSNSRTILEGLDPFYLCREYSDDPDSITIMPPLTHQFVCQTFVGDLECVFPSSKLCSEELQKYFSNLFFKLRNLELCSKYF